MEVIHEFKDGTVRRTLDGVVMPESISQALAHIVRDIQKAREEKESKR